MSLQTLKDSAKRSARWHEHELAAFVTCIPKQRAIAHCRNCDAWVQVDTKPEPNGIDIGGPAVAVDCGDLK